MFEWSTTDGGHESYLGNFPPSYVPPVGPGLWVPTPPGRTSAQFSEELLEEASVVVSPGTGYGPHGEGFVRISLTVPDERLEEAMGRIRGHLR